MKSVDREMLWDMLAGSCAVLGFWCFLPIGKHYHGYYGLTLEDLKPLGFLAVSWSCLAAFRWAGWPQIYACVRGWMWLALAVGLWTRYGAVMVMTSGKALTTCALLLIVSAGVVAHHKASSAVWAGLRRMIGVVPALIVATPVLLGQVLDEPRVWLGPNTGNAPGKSATVVLLYDEMNAQASQDLQRLLIERGLLVNFKAIAPVHLSTTEVVPEIFTGIDFGGARACGGSRICTHNEALDFSQLSVGREDVDVVGFHHPYCAISGLRYCKRLTTSKSIQEEGRWACVILRLLGVYAGVDRARCQEIAHRSWNGLQNDVVKALLDAPALSQGGVLYAHIPFPHLPAPQTGTLAEQYEHNLKRSKQVLERLLDVMAVNGVEPKLLIFSDHPLRQKMYCDREAFQFDGPCDVKPELVDPHVPLIVAAKSDLPAIAHVQSNREVFDVLRTWLAR